MPRALTTGSVAHQHLIVFVGAVLQVVRTVQAHLLSVRPSLVDPKRSCTNSHDRLGNTLYRRRCGYCLRIQNHIGLDRRAGDAVDLRCAHRRITEQYIGAGVEQPGQMYHVQATSYAASTFARFWSEQIGWDDAREHQVRGTFFGSHRSDSSLAPEFPSSISNSSNKQREARLSTLLTSVSTRARDYARDPLGSGGHPTYSSPHPVSPFVMLREGKSTPSFLTESRGDGSLSDSALTVRLQYETP